MSSGWGGQRRAHTVHRPGAVCWCPATAADQESCCGGWSPFLSWPAGPHLSLTQNTAICIYIYYVFMYLCQCTFLLFIFTLSCSLQKSESHPSVAHGFPADRGVSEPRAEFQTTVPPCPSCLLLHSFVQSLAMALKSNTLT